MARCTDRLPAHLYAGRVALSRASRAFPAARPTYLQLPQQDGPDRTSNSRAGSIHAAQWCRRRRRALERGNVAVSAVRFRPEDASHRALRRLLPSQGHDDPGLGHHLRRTRTSLRSVRIPLRDVGNCGKSQGADPGRWQSVRRSPFAPIPHTGAGAAVQPCAVRESRDRTRIQAISPALRQSLAGVHQPFGTTDGPMHLLRLLRGGSVAATIRRPVRRRRSCPISFESPISRCATNRKSSESTWIAPASARPG